MKPEQIILMERIRTMNADEPVVREVSMFGGRSVMVNEKTVDRGAVEDRLTVGYVITVEPTDALNHGGAEPDPFSNTSGSVRRPATKASS